MRRRQAVSLVVLLGCIQLFAPLAANAEELDSDSQDKVNAKLKIIQTWAADPVIVNAVKAQNAEMPEAYKSLNQTTWKTLSVLEPLVRRFTKNEVGLFLKSKKDATVSEAFVSAADGSKVGFLSKPTFWNHTGKPKHEQPMKGEVWRGPVEVDESTGVQQMQVAVPVLENGKPIGSLVVGLEITKLKD